MGVIGGPKIVRDNLEFIMDSGNPDSYNHDSVELLAFDMTQNDNKGYLFNGVDVTDNGLFDFDGVDDYIDFGTDVSALDGASQFTISFWQKKSFTSAGYSVSKSSGGSRVSIAPWSDGNWYLNNSNVSSSYGIMSGLVNDVWLNVVMIFDGGQTGNANRLKGYLNGDIQTLGFSGTIPTTSADLSSELFTVGYQVNASNTNGLITDVKIYDRALTNEEVKQNYNVQRTRFEAITTVGSTLTGAADEFFSSSYADITGSDERNALRRLVANAQDHGWWDKCLAIYPMCSDGVNKTRDVQHTYNLKDPTLHPMVWSGTVSHTAALGAQGDNTTGYGYSGIGCDVELPGFGASETDNHMSYYTTTSGGGGAQMGYNLSGNITFRLSSTAYLNPKVFGCQPTDPSLTEIAFRLGNAKNGVYQMWENGVKEDSVTACTPGNNWSVPGDIVFLGLAWNASATNVFNFTDTGCGFSSIGKGLTNTEAYNMSQDIIQYQSDLSR